MEQPQSPNAFTKGNPKFGIKTGVQRPKPLKSSTERRLQLPFKQLALEDKESERSRNNPCKNDASNSSVPKGMSGLPPIR